MRKQCKACPWKLSTVPGRDIPGGYDPEKHEALISCQGNSPSRMMACHEFPVGKEQPCVGWVINQLGPGNNIPLRLRAMSGVFKDYRLVGPQHETIQAMCSSARKPKKRQRR